MSLVALGMNALGWKSALRNLTLLLLLPGLALAIWFSQMLPLTPLLSFLQGASIAPAVLLPFGARALRIQPDLARTAAGLGATRSQRFRTLWLPLLGWPLASTIALAILISLSCAWRL
ncbi:hypothetical protein [Brytella acorum]|uniref:Uncharacterized protein n=1 Tax=Brytella acorum TaxID=2959299 RepID=A0AA35V947_9PROT|nr:hypothetical protein [Brytella acorum]MDF3623780.1 hypothetical protein [Brytella acorum]CAI9121808.1 hypothetical protein LMG32879_002662 [Brytella acorum]